MDGRHIKNPPKIDWFNKHVEVVSADGDKDLAKKVEKKLKEKWQKDCDDFFKFKRAARRR